MNELSEVQKRAAQTTGATAHRSSIGPVLRLGAAGALVVWTLLAGAAPASAHAGLVAASPAPGHGLPQAPGSVALRFSEPLHRKLSRIEVIGPDGRDSGVGTTQAVERDPAAMRRKLALLRPGQYRVQWVSVSTIDGHTLRGSYSFGIGTAAVGDERERASPVDSEGWLGLAGRWLAMAGLSLWSGVVVLAGVAKRGGLPASQVALMGRLGPALALVGTTASVVSAALVSTGSFSHVTDVLSGQSGQLRAMALAVALVGVLVPPRLGEVQAPLAALAVFAEVASGHAAASIAPSVATISAAVHVGAVGVWLVGLVGAAVAPSARRFLGVVWPHAVAAAAVVALTGTLNAVLELTRPGDLWSTGYGRTVAAKIVLLTAMAGLGVTHQLLRRRPGADATLRLPVRLELVAAALALAAATALVGFPNPPRSAEAAERSSGEDPVLADLASHEAVSLAEASGPFVVALTVLPPRPGPVEFRVNVVGLEAGDGVGDVRLQSSGPGGAGTEVALGGCGAGCFRVRGRIGAAGPWSFRVTAASTRSPIEVAFAVELPTPDGTPVLRRALAELDRLRSVAMEEELRGSPHGPTITARYRFSAPAAFDFMVGDRSQIVIGDRSYERPGPGATWTAKAWPGRPFEWPGAYYRSVWARPAAVRVLGTEDLEGQPMTVIAFVRPNLPAWIRLWVGVRDGLVHREQMRAEGHLMDRIYKAFDASGPIVPPPTGP